MAETRAVVRGAPLPRSTKGDLNVLWKAMLDRLIITLPFGAPQIVIGGLQPTTNVGLWLKDGTKPYVWDENTKAYIPADLTDSLPQIYWYGDTTPTDSDPPIWLRTFGGGTRAAWYFWDAVNSTWFPANGVPNSGTTAERPTNPLDLEEYWDTDIDCKIHWERGQWRTVSGTPGDIKFVDVGLTDYSTSVTEALTRNPGWVEIDIAYRGRSPVFAGSGAGLTSRSPQDTYGEETHALTEAELASHTHTMATQTFVDEADVGVGVTYIVSGSGMVTGATGSGTPHNTIGPSVAFVGLKKT